MTVYTLISTVSIINNSNSAIIKYYASVYFYKLPVGGGVVEEVAAKHTVAILFFLS